MDLLIGLGMIGAVALLLWYIGTRLDKGGVGDESKILGKTN